MSADRRDDLNLSEAFELAREAVKALLAINGGAAIAMLAFFGQVFRDGPAESLRNVVGSALSCFGAGVLSATSVLLLAYFSQLLIGVHYGGNQRRAALAEKTSTALRIVAMIAAVGSGGLFLAGALHARWIVVHGVMAAVPTI